MNEDGTHFGGLVNRVEVIDARGRVWVQYYEDAGAMVAIQDDGRTLKIFAGTPKRVP